MPDHLLNHPRIPQALVLILALVTTLLALGRTLPWQNVITAAVLIGLVSGTVQTVGVKTGMPFGQYFYASYFGPRLFQLLPWPVPCLWIVALLNSRGVARLLLRPWRNRPNPGLRVIALTSLLAVIFDAGLEPFAARVNYYWIWRTAGNALLWYGAPWTNFAGWAFTALLALVITSPWLLDKKPQTDPPPDYYPLVLWVILTLLMAIAGASCHLGTAAIFTLATTAVIAVLACVNSRPDKTPVKRAVP
jgi:putative membrane protein